MNLFRTPRLLTWLYPQLTWRIPVQSKTLFLTFDDGPLPGPTEFVLEQLTRFSAKATFFCIGDNVRKHPEILRQVASARHRIGNHTYNHLKGWATSTETYLDNTRQCDEVLQSTLDVPQGTFRLFRPPYGRIRRDQIRQLTAYHIIMWDVLTHDYVQGISGEKCLRGSLKASRPGSIVVFHDSQKAEKNLRYVLPRYLEDCSSQGYTFEVIPDHPAQVH